MRDNGDQIGALDVCPSLKTALESAQNPVLGGSLITKRSKIAAKSLVVEDFTPKSFKSKDLGGNSP